MYVVLALRRSGVLELEEVDKLLFGTWRRSNILGSGGFSSASLAICTPCKRNSRESPPGNGILDNVGFGVGASLSRSG